MKQFKAKRRKERLIDFFLCWWKRDLERQIDFMRWDPSLSLKIDALTILLEGEEA